VLSGQAPTPWRYRLFAEWVSAGFLVATQALGIPRPISAGFLGLRLVQNTLIFAIAFVYYRRLGLEARPALVGMMVLGAACTYANYNSDLSANTYFDVLFYLLAGVAVLTPWKPAAFLGVTVVAALNRETSAFLPMLPVVSLVARPDRIAREWRRVAPPSLVAFAVWATIFFGVRAWAGPPARSWEEQWGFVQGLPSVAMNLRSHITLTYLAVTFTLLPLLTLWQFRGLPDFLRGLFWLMVLPWLGLHLVMVPVNETRIFLVPIAMVLIPGALYPRAGAADRGSESSTAASRDATGAR
jgi:hypothetical protein